MNATADTTANLIILNRTARNMNHARAIAEEKGWLLIDAHDLEDDRGVYVTFDCTTRHPETGQVLQPNDFLLTTESVATGELLAADIVPLYLRPLECARKLALISKRDRRIKLTRRDGRVAFNSKGGRWACIEWDIEAGWTATAVDTDATEAEASEHRGWLLDHYEGLSLSDVQVINLPEGIESGRQYIEECM